MIFSDFKLIERLLKPVKVYNLYHFRPLEKFSFDTRSLKPGQGFIAIKGKHKDGHDFVKKAVAKGAALVIAEKYIPTKVKVPFYLVKDSQDSLVKIATYLRKRKKPFVYGITGSLGKTTTKDILAYLLEAEFKVLKNKHTENNLFGVSKTILSLDKEKVVVLELGTNAKGEIGLLAGISNPDVGVVTFIKPVHLQGLESLSGVYREKLSLFTVNPKMKAVLNHDDSYLAKTRLNKKIYWFGKAKSNDIFFRLVKRDKAGSWFKIQGKYDLFLPFNREIFMSNILAALLSARLLGLPLNRLVERVNNFKDFPSMRMQISQNKGFFIINDAYNASPYSVQKALESLKSYPLKKIVVLGDMLELGKKSKFYHQQLADLVKKSGFDCCLTFGEQTLCLKKQLEKSGYKKVYHFTRCKDVGGFINDKLKGRPDLKKRYLIFLKGSRKMRLEKVLDYLR